MNIQQAAKLLGGDAFGNQVLCPGPNHSAKDRSLSVKFGAGHDGFTCLSFAGDDFRECRDHVKAALGIGREQQPIEFAAPPAPATDDDRIRFALSLWHDTVPLAGTLAETYLASRGVGRNVSIQNLQFHRSLKYDGRRVPAMVGLYRDIETDAPCGVHRTFLSSDGKKLDRKMLGRSKNAAIKLDGLSGAILHVGEGIETVLSGRQLGFTPAWACTSAGLIGDFPVIPAVRYLSVFTENDRNGTNQREAGRAAKRWIEAGKSVLTINPVGGKDLNDILARAINTSDDAGNT